MRASCGWISGATLVASLAMYAAVPAMGQTSLAQFEAPNRLPQAENSPVEK